MKPQQKLPQFVITALVFSIAIVLGPTTNLVSAQVKEQVSSLGIDGPFEVEPGELVRLKAAIDESESPFWIVLKPDDLQYEQIEHGNGLILRQAASHVVQSS